MDDWADEFHVIMLRMLGAMNRPDVDAAFVARAGVKLDRALFPLLSRIGIEGPIGTVELAALTGRDHSTVSRQVAKLEALGLVERATAERDRRVRLLKPTAAGEAMLSEFRKVRREMIAEHFADWTEEERRIFLALLKRTCNKSAASPGGKAKLRDDG
jgi:DNA-binding MarR family transcriptional regulator